MATVSKHWENLYSTPLAEIPFHCQSAVLALFPSVPDDLPLLLPARWTVLETGDGSDFGTIVKGKDVSGIGLGYFRV
jgi:hypothetical protein